MEEAINEPSQSRVIWMDYLRILATLSVVILHVSCQNYDIADLGSFEWKVFVAFDSISRWGVPVFVMLSGALLLTKDIPIRKLYSKYIPRLAVSFFVWSALYASVYSVVKLVLEAEPLSFRYIAVHSVTGLLHLWFIPMLIGLYMCIPIFRHLIRSEACTKYYLSLSFIFAFLIPQVYKIANDFIGGSIAELIGVFNDLSSEMDMSVVLGYAFYFVLGYLLWKTDISKKQRSIVYILGIAGFLSTVLLSVSGSLKNDTPVDYYGNFTVNVFLEAVSVFIWFKYNVRGNVRTNKYVEFLSKYSFGVYLVHVFVRDTLSVFGIHSLAFSPVISVPCISVLIFIISYVISFIINKIPVLNKWIV